MNIEAHSLVNPIRRHAYPFGSTSIGEAAMRSQRIGMRLAIRDSVPRASNSTAAP